MADFEVPWLPRPALAALVGLVAAFALVVGQPSAVEDPSLSLPPAVRRTSC